MCMHIQLTQARTEAKLGARLDLVGNRETHGYMDTIQILHTLGIEDTDTHRVKYLGYGYSSPLSI